MLAARLLAMSVAMRGLARFRLPGVRALGLLRSVAMLAMLAAPVAVGVTVGALRLRLRPLRAVLVGGRDRHADQLLDVAQERPLLAVAERDRDAVGAGARGAADAMHVALRDVRQVVVDDVADAFDVDAAGGDVGGDQGAHLAVAEGREHALALALRLVAVDGLGGEAAL